MRFRRRLPFQSSTGRADPYDNQVGEIETAERGLGYGEFERSKEVLLCESFPSDPKQRKEA